LPLTWLPRELLCAKSRVGAKNNTPASRNGIVRKRVFKGMNFDLGLPVKMRQIYIILPKKKPPDKNVID
jgi:hypothetical protein